MIFSGKGIKDPWYEERPSFVAAFFISPSGAGLSFRNVYRGRQIVFDRDGINELVGTGAAHIPPLPTIGFKVLDPPDLTVKLFIPNLHQCAAHLIEGLKVPLNDPLQPLKLLPVLYFPLWLSRMPHV